MEGGLGPSRGGGEAASHPLRWRKGFRPPSPRAGRGPADSGATAFKKSLRTGTAPGSGRAEQAAAGPGFWPQVPRSPIAPLSLPPALRPGPAHRLRPEPPSHGRLGKLRPSQTAVCPQGFWVAPPPKRRRVPGRAGWAGGDRGALTCSSRPRDRAARGSPCPRVRPPVCRLLAWAPGLGSGRDARLGRARAGPRGGT